MKLSLTRGQIITEALETAGRPDLVSNARLWLNLFLEEFYMNQDVEWLVKTATLSLTDGLAFPTDYRAAKIASVIRNSNSMFVPVTSDFEMFKLHKKQNTTAGIPILVLANHDSRVFNFSPEPISGLQLEISYYFMPALADHTDVESDDLEVKWELPKSILIEALKGMVHEYNDDERQAVSDQKVMAKVQASKFNQRDSRAGTTRMSMGKSFRKRF